MLCAGARRLGWASGRWKVDGRVLRGPERSTLAPGAPHVVIDHFDVDGSARARLEEGPEVELSPGAIVVFPRFSL